MRFTKKRSHRDAISKKRDSKNIPKRKFVVLFPLSFPSSRSLFLRSSHPPASAVIQK